MYVIQIDQLNYLIAKYYNIYLLFRHTENGCVQHVWFVQNSALIVRLVRVMHKRAIIAWIVYALEKTIYWLKKTIQLGKTIYGSKRTIYGLRLFAEYLVYFWSHDALLQEYMNAMYKG